MTMTSKKKQTILAALLLAANISAFAQGNGMAGITEATMPLFTGYFSRLALNNSSVIVLIPYYICIGNACLEEERA